MIAPFTDAFRDHIGPFVIQFPPAPPGHRLAAESLDLGRSVYVLVNNKAEGCAPLTIRVLAGQ